MQANLRSPIWLYAHPSMEEIAHGIVQRCLEHSQQTTHSHSQPTDSDHLELGTSTGTAQALSLERHISCRERRPVELKSTIKWEKFPDGFPNLFIDDVKNLAGKDVIFLGSFHSPQVIFEQLSILYAIPRYLARSFTFILPYFPTGTMERVDTEGQIATAKTLATLLSSTPLTARGPSQVMVFDIHALQERFYFSDNIIPRLESAIPLLKRELKQLPSSDQLAIAFPDDGAFKRFHTMFEGLPTIICTKVRDGKKRHVRVKDGDPVGCHVIIVDDLVQTGGTLIECAKALTSGGATKVSAYVSHAVFPNNSWRRFTEGDVRLDTFWITDSVPHARDIGQHQPFKLLCLADVIAAVLLGYDLKQA